MARIALSGYYGCGNTGDEAVLAGIVESFAKRGAAMDFVVLSADPADTKARHGLAAVDRMKAGVVRQTLREADLLLSGGGSLLQDTTSLRSLVYYLWVVRTGRSLGRPVMFYAQGIGPLRRSVSRLLTRVVANRVQQITVRDDESRELLRRIGVTKPPLNVTADPAFALSPADPDTVDAVLQRADVPLDRSLVGVALRPWHTGHPTPEQGAELLRQAMRQTGAHPVLIPMQPPGDILLSEQSAKLLPPGSVSLLRETLSPAQMMGVLHRMDGVIAMRLHALILAAGAGIPLVALSYDPKVTQLMRLLGQQERVMPLENFAAERVASLLNETLSDDSLQKRLVDRAAELSRLALRNVDYALPLLKVPSTYPNHPA